MEDVLDLYSEPPDPRRPVVCFDDTPVQLIGETRTPWPAQPGKPARIDYEYRRNGTANLFVFLDAHRPWRHVKVTERKTAHDFARCMYELAQVHYREAETVRVVLDNLSAHKPAGGEAAQARRGGPCEQDGAHYLGADGQGGELSRADGGRHGRWIGPGPGSGTRKRDQEGQAGTWGLGARVADGPNRVRAGRGTK